MSMQTQELTYKPKLDFFETQKAIAYVKKEFSANLSYELNLIPVVAPKILEVGTGLQDDLALTQTAVRFSISDTGQVCEIPHSLAKWKRSTLGEYDFKSGSGLYTDMQAIRKDEDLSRIHSISVDQWDWEKVIEKKDRTLDYLSDTVEKIYSAIKRTQTFLHDDFPDLALDHKLKLPELITYIHTEDLEKEFPSLSEKERENMAAQKYGAIFLIGIGYPLESGKPHDVRAADYDDWITETKEGYHGLNGDLIVWDPVSESALELSSMGIRVDSDSLDKQLSMGELDHYRSLPFHEKVLSDKLPLSIGGGIGQSRIVILLLKK